MRAEGEENLLSTSLALLSAAVALGALLLAGVARRAAPVHGALGAAGVAALCAAAFSGRLRAPLGVAVGVLLLATLCGGVAIWRGWRPGLLVFLHAVAGGVATLLLGGMVFG